MHTNYVDEVIKNLQGLCKHNNTVLVVEHDKAVISSADHIIELGPGGGKKGGNVIAQGSLKDILSS